MVILNCVFPSPSHIFMCLGGITTPICLSVACADAGRNIARGQFGGAQSCFCKVNKIGQTMTVHANFRRDSARWVTGDHFRDDLHAFTRVCHSWCWHLYFSQGRFLICVPWLTFLSRHCHSLLGLGLCLTGIWKVVLAASDIYASRSWGLS